MLAALAAKAGLPQIPPTPRPLISSGRSLPSIRHVSELPCCLICVHTGQGCRLYRGVKACWGRGA